MRNYCDFGNFDSCCQNRFKSDEKSFWKPLFLMTGAICLPVIVIIFLYYFSIIFTNNTTLKSSLNYTLIFGFALIPIISAITFLVYLIFWKLKNRTFILSLTAICFSVMIISTNSTLGTLPKVFEYSIKNGKIFVNKNNNGGILGGMTTGAPIIVKAAIKPTPSISKPQKSVNLQTMTEEELVIHGRHDPCIVPRALPVIESAVAFALLDLMA